MDKEQDPDDILAELEADDNDDYRAQRLAELKSEAQSGPDTSSNAVQSVFKTLSGDDECLQFTTEYERAVVHFFHPDFARCSIMDRHCEHIGRKHAQDGGADMAFARVDVRNAPFVVEKLGIRVLPAVLGFVKGVVKGRVTGFEGIAWGGREELPSVAAALEEKLVEWTVLRKRLLEDEAEDEEEEKPERSKFARRGIKDRKQNPNDDEDDWD
jgi:hypothetical protein